jgi:ATP-dependent DNA helicase PIF1
MLELSHEQKVTFDAAMKDQNLFISGPGGVGKSYVLTRIIEEFRARNRKFRVAASTGVAALNIGGATIHSLLGTDIQQTIEKVRPYLGNWQFRVAQDRLNPIDTIIVDEVSMLSGDYIQMMDFWLRQIRGSSAPFGGIQIIFCGDFLQLPPVEKGKNKPRWRYAFNSPAWESANFLTIDLTYSYRQEDQTFVNALNRVRFGDYNKDVRRVFRPCIGRELTKPTHLVSTNKEASTINFQNLREHPGEMFSHSPRFTFLKQKLKPERKEQIADALIRDSLTENPLQLKVGVPVILLKNHRDGMYVNGSRGIVTEIVPYPHGEIEKVKVLLGENDREITVLQTKWERVAGNGAIEAALVHFPMRLAWALTIHKAQGLTLDNVEIDLARGFAPGQAYVALSRLTSLEGLALTDAICPSIVKADSEIVKFYDDAIAERGGDV